MSQIEHEEGAKVPPIKNYPDKFAGQVVLVTGAASGIGEVTARLFAAQGAQVLAFDVNEESLSRVQASVQESGCKMDCRTCDVSDEHQVNEAIEWAIWTHKKVDVLANLAGVYPFHRLDGYPSDMYHRIMNVNLNGTFFLTRAVMPHMVAAGYGRIVHTSSSTTSDPQPGLSAYVASKAGVVGLVRAAAAEAGPGVTVNAVMPGLINTDGVRSNPGSQRLFDHLISRQQVKRRGHPLDIAHAICFIASPEAAFFTGQSFDCSGGDTFH